MELNRFWEGIRLMPGAVDAVSKLRISEAEYEKIRSLFCTDKDAFYQAVLKEPDFRVRFLYYFSRMACETYARYQERGIDDQVYWDTFYDLTLWCGNCYQEFGEYGINEYRWFFRHIECRIWRLGRLEFEETEIGPEELGVAPEGQGKIPVWNIHIPQGEKLDPDSVRASLEQAFQRWGKQIPYVCDSWLLYPGLADILPADSNIIRFQKLFRILRTDPDAREAEPRIFGQILEHAGDYPEDTFLQKKAKEYLLEGKRLGSGMGILKTNS